MAPLGTKTGQYFCDFEFWSAATQLYWLPLHLVASSPREVEAFIAPLHSGLTANYRLIRATAPARIVRGLRSPSVAEFQNKKLVGIPNLLDRATWTMRSAQSPTRIAFEFLPPAVENLLVDLSAISLRTPTANTGPSPFAFDLTPRSEAEILRSSARAKQDHFVLFNVVVAGE